jgi:phage-related protein
VSQAVSRLIDWLNSPSFQAFVHNVSNTIGAILGSLQDVVRWLSANAGTIATVAMDVVQGVLDAIKGAIHAITGILDGDLRKFLDGIGQMFAGIGEAIFQPLARALGGLWDMGKDAGGKIIDGLTDGIRGGAGHLQDAMADMAKNAIDTAKNILGIHSPSAVFRDEIGQHISSGMAEGIKAKGGDVSSAVRATSSGALGGLAPSGSGGGSTSITIASGAIQIYGAPGQQMDALADIVISRLQQRVGGRF